METVSINQQIKQLIDTKQTFQTVLSSWRDHIFEEFKIQMWYSKILSKLHEPLLSAIWRIQNSQILIQDKYVIFGELKSPQITF